MILIGLIIWYAYSAEQTRQQGFEFGNDLLNIQEEVKQLQINFNSKLTQWDEGDLTKQELLEYADSHFENLSDVVNSYDNLAPPSQFLASVNLFKLSTSSQLESDKNYIEWIKTGKNSDRIRSDSLLQESFDFEILALGEFNKAKLGHTEYDDAPEKFQEPDVNITNKVNKIWINMKEKCQLMQSQEDIQICISEADAWKTEHMP